MYKSIVPVLAALALAACKVAPARIGPTAAPTVAAIPVDWATYQDSANQFALRYPALWEIASQEAGSLQFKAGAVAQADVRIIGAAMPGGPSPESALNSLVTYVNEKYQSAKVSSLTKGQWTQSVYGPFVSLIILSPDGKRHDVAGFWLETSLDRGHYALASLRKTGEDITLAEQQDVARILSSIQFQPALTGTGVAATRAPAPTRVQVSTTPAIVLTPATPSASGCPTYTIQAGDIPAHIAEQFGISVDELERINGISDPRTLQVGQQLNLPCPAGQ